MEGTAGTSSVVPQSSLSGQGIFQRFLDGRDLIRLEIAVYDANFVRSVETCTDLCGQSSDPMRSQHALSLKQLSKVFASQVFHDVRDDTFLRIGDKVIDINEVFVSDLSDGPCLAKQSRHQLGVPAVEHFDCSSSTESLVFSQIDATHCPRAQ